MREPRSMEVTFTDSHHLRLSLKTTESGGVNHPAAVPFVYCPDVFGRVRVGAVEPSLEKRGRLWRQAGSPNLLSPKGGQSSHQSGVRTTELDLLAIIGVECPTEKGRRQSSPDVDQRWQRCCRRSGFLARWAADAMCSYTRPAAFSSSMHFRSNLFAVGRNE